MNNIKVNILYDYQIFEAQKYGGISRYYFELIHYFENNPDWQISWDLSILYSSNGFISEMPALKKKVVGDADYYNRFAFGWEFKGKWFLFQRYKKLFPEKFKKNQLTSIEMLKNGNFDIFHPTDFNEYFLKYIGKKKLVITILDMIDELYPEYSFPVHSEYKSSIKKEMIMRADKIIAISNSTKQDILDFYNVPEEKIEVIYLGNSLAEKSKEYLNMPKIISVPKKYLLFVGKRVHYKNFYFFLQGVASFLLEDKDLFLICIGGDFDAKENQYINDLGLSGKVLVFQANDKELMQYYQYAIAFVYPSLYEGFGIPILEAYACKCPVILSKSSCFPEVAGDAAIYFEPKSIVSLRNALHQVISNTELRNSLIEKGTEQLKRYSWRKTAQQTSELYKTLVYKS